MKREGSRARRIAHLFELCFKVRNLLLVLLDERFVILHERARRRDWNELGALRKLERVMSLFTVARRRGDRGHLRHHVREIQLAVWDIPFSFVSGAHTHKWNTHKWALRTTQMRALPLSEY